MGITKKTFEQIGGFSDIHPGEDPDLSYRIMKAGLSTGLIPNAFVYHKRRVDFSKFAKQTIPRNFIVDKKGKIAVISTGFSQSEFNKIALKVKELLK